MGQNHYRYTRRHIAIIKHARKSLLFYNGKTWVKTDSNSLFDLTMGSYELVGLYVLEKLSEKFDNENVGLYRHDGLMLLSGNGSRLADKARNEITAQHQSSNKN